MLPTAVAIALSPLGIVTVVVLVLGDGGRLRAALFTSGWLVTIATAATAAFLVVDASAASDPSETADGVDIVQLVLGLVFWVLAGVSWRSRPAEGGAGPEAKLLERVARITPLGALGLGLVQSVVVIKTIPLALGAGAQLGESELDGGEAVVALVAFALLATAGMWGPVVVSAVGGDRLRGPMTDVQTWLQDNVTPITIVVLVVLGAVFVGRGLAVLG